MSDPGWEAVRLQVFNTLTMEHRERESKAQRSLPICVAGADARDAEPHEKGGYSKVCFDH